MVNEDLRYLPAEAVHPMGSILLRDTVANGADEFWADFESTANRREFWELQARKVGEPSLGQVYAGSGNNMSPAEAINIRRKETRVNPIGLARYRHNSRYFITPGFLIARKALEDIGVKFGILSSGFEETIPNLGIPVRANVFAYDPENSNRITGFKDGDLLAQRNGKLLTLEEDRRNGSSEKRIIMWGDGKNDAATQPQALFILFTGVVRREDVIDELRENRRLPPMISDDFADGVVIAAGQKRWKMLWNHRDSKVTELFARGAQRIIDKKTEILNPLDQIVIADKLQYFIKREARNAGY